MNYLGMLYQSAKYPPEDYAGVVIARSYAELGRHSPFVIVSDKDGFELLGDAVIEGNIVTASSGPHKDKMFHWCKTTAVVNLESPEHYRGLILDKFKQDKRFVCHEEPAHEVHSITPAGTTEPMEVRTYFGYVIVLDFDNFVRCSVWVTTEHQFDMGSAVKRLFKDCPIVPTVSDIVAVKSAECLVNNRYMYKGESIMYKGALNSVPVGGIFITKGVGTNV